MFITSLEDIDCIFENSKINQLYRNIDKLLIEKNIYSRIKELYGDDVTPIVKPEIHNLTPREYYINRYFHCTTFYYIEKLMEINPSKILDIGCGSNIFKKFYPIIYGVDPIIVGGADEVDSFNDNFIEKHTEEYECAMSICSLHHDISYTFLKKRIYDFLKIIKPGGRAYIALNSMVLLANMDKKYFNYFYDSKSTTYKIETHRDFVNKLIDQLGKKVNILEYHNLIGYGMDRSEFDIHIDGDIRILIEKT